MLIFRLYFVDSVFQSLINEVSFRSIYHTHDPLEYVCSVASSVCFWYLRNLALRSAFSSSSCVSRAGESDRCSAWAIIAHAAVAKRIFWILERAQNLFLAPERLPLRQFKSGIWLWTSCRLSPMHETCGRMQMP
eukprot:scaffold3724_cov123-Skeletonema_dohrnii-CCMP3373.AAC.1